MSSDDVNDRDTFLSAAEAYIKGGLYGHAKLLAEKRILVNDGDMDAAFIRAICLVGMGQAEEARDILRFVDEMIYRWSGLYALLGETCRTMKLMSEAGRAYHSAGALKAAVHAREEMMADREDEPHESDQEGLSDLGELSQDFHTVTLADLYIKQGHFEMARAVLKSVTARDPDNAGVHERLGYVETMLIGEKKGSHRAVVVELQRWLRHLERKAST
ncbi:MAG: hypothetical protein JXR85_01885 [Deltaproteobacteria bacterium]|nr:hypothetical protein [Deltaproteobacteria bacterium]